MTNHIQNNIDNLLEEIKKAAAKSGRNWKDIKLIAVSKTVSADRIKGVYDSGISRFGENKVQEAIQKIELLPDDIEWHFIGTLQRNKVKYLRDYFTLFHSLDNLKLAYEIDRIYTKRGDVLKVLIQINISRESSKHGIYEEDAVNFVNEVSKLKGLKVCGLMTIPAYSEDPENSRDIYKRLRQLRDHINSSKIESISMDELSMGMSLDYKIAIEEGATMIRVGSYIFGERVY